ncbi:MAG: hypothetical protein KJ000_10135 [Pirellulaceae bacterium]|nr:hypothetical protein [Pirellulaceae bacterium]
MNTNASSRLVRSVTPHPARWLTLAFVAVLTLAPSVVQAQTPRDQRRELVEGLLRTFLEAQIEKNLRPDRPAPPPQAIPADLVKAREALSGFAREAKQLYELLQAESVRNATARQYLPDMMRVAAQAGVLADQSTRIYDVQLLGREFRDLDRQWRLLSYRLDQADGLARLCSPSVRRLDGFAAALGQLCGIQPQTDYRELLRQTDALNADLQRLVDEIEIGLGRTRDAQMLQFQGRRIQQQVRLLANLIAQQTSRTAIVAEFQRYQQSWQPFAASLWPLGQRNLERTLRSIEETDRQIHELLWLPVPINRQHLQHLTEVLMDRVDELLDRVTLRVLMELRGAENVLNTAGEFHGVCEHFAGVVVQRGTPVELRQEYQFVVEAWPAFSACFRSARDPDILNLLKEIELTFVALRDALRIAPEFDRRLAVQRAALLAYSSERLADEVRDGAGKDSRYPPPWRTGFVQASSTFRQETQAFNEALMQRRTVTELADMANQLTRSWVRLQRDYLPKVDAARRGTLDELANEITPVLVELQAMF